MEPDVLLRRIERRALVLTAIGAAIAYAVPGGGLAGTASVSAMATRATCVVHLLAIRTEAKRREE